MELYADEITQSNRQNRMQIIYFYTHEKNRHIPHAVPVFCEVLNIFLHCERVSKPVKSSSFENAEKCVLCENLSDFCKRLMYNSTVNIVITFL